MLVFEIQDLSDTVIEGNYTTIIKEYYWSFNFRVFGSI